MTERNTHQLPSGVFKAPDEECNAEIRFDFWAKSIQESIIGISSCPGPNHTCALSLFNKDVFDAEVKKGNCALMEMITKYNNLNFSQGKS